MVGTAPVSEGTILAGKYRVERVLGSGGMGVVVAARHLTLGERVAIKFLLPEASMRPDVIARFVREGRAAARIRSEHVARVFDVGTLEDGAPYLVMEYLEGHDLAALLRGHGPLPLPVAVDYVLQACEALADAHALGIVHRDLKPGNLFLTRKSDGSAAIKLIDFGISKLVGTGREGEVDVTASAMMMGSPLFMAPEQMKSARDVDARADVWSTGCILFMLLTGRAPYLGESVMAIYDRILEGPPRPSQFVMGVPPEIDHVVARCLERDVARRLPDVGALAAAIAPFGAPGAIDRASRIARILAVGRGAPAALPSNSPPGPTVVPVHAPPVSQPPPGMTPAQARSGTGASDPREPGTDGPWNSTNGPQRRRTRGFTFGLVAIGVVALAGVAALAWSKLAHHDSTVASPDPSVATSAAVAPVAVAPSSEPAPDPSTSASAASAEAPPVAEPPASASASASAKAPRAPGPKPRPAGPPGQPKRDLFGDPR